MFLNIIKSKILFVLKRYNYKENFIFIFKNLIFLTPFNYILSSGNIYLSINIFKKIFVNFLFNLFKFIMKDLKIKYNNNSLFNKFDKILNIYKIAALSMLKYVKIYIYRILITQKFFKSILRFI